MIIIVILTLAVITGAWWGIAIVRDTTEGHDAADRHHGQSDRR